MSNFILNYDSITDSTITHGKLSKVSNEILTLYNVKALKPVERVSFVKFPELLLKTGSFVYFSENEVACVDFIIKYENKLFALISIYSIICFDSHFYMYILDKQSNYSAVPLDSLNVSFVCKEHIIRNSIAAININKIQYESMVHDM